MDHNELPKVSIITSVFNAENTLEKCIISVKHQTYPNLEYIVIDGGSSDKSVEIIKNYNDVVTVWKSEPDEGIYDAWNKGLQRATGEWILFLGADDVLKPNALMDLLACHSKETLAKADYISGRSEIVKNNQVINITGFPWSWARFRKFMCTAQCGALHSRKLYQEVGVYDISFKIAGDYELLLRKGKNLRALFVDSVVVSFRLGGASNRDNRVIWETKRAILKNKSLSYVQAYFNSFRTLAAKFLKGL